MSNILQNDKQLITIQINDDYKFNLMYHIRQQSLYDIMSWLINEFKYKSLNDYRFSQDGNIIETTTDAILTDELLYKNPRLKLNKISSNVLAEYDYYKLNNNIDSNNESINVYIRTITNNITIINVNSKNTTVYELKLRIHEMDAIEPNNQTFYYNGVQLEDNKLLLDYDIQNESMISLITYNQTCISEEYNETDLCFDICYFRG